MPCSRKAILALGFLGFIVYGQQAMGHARLLQTPEVMPRDTNVGNKYWPCGPGSEPGTPTVIKPGTTIEIQFEETINHHGWWHFHLSTNGDEGFDTGEFIELKPPIEDLRDFERDPDADYNRQLYTTSITIPDDVDCNNCVLQLAQEMEDKSPLAETVGTDIEYPTYYSCADMQITLDAPSLTVSQVRDNLIEMFPAADSDSDNRLSELEVMNAVAEVDADMYDSLAELYDDNADFHLSLAELQNEPTENNNNNTGDEEGIGSLGFGLLSVLAIVGIRRRKIRK